MLNNNDFNEDQPIKTVSIRKQWVKMPKHEFIQCDIVLVVAMLCWLLKLVFVTLMSLTHVHNIEDAKQRIYIH